MNNEEKILTLLEKHSVILEKLETDITGVKSELSEVKSEIEKHSSVLERLDSELTEVKADITEVKANVASLEAVLTDTRHHVISIENNHSKELGALHDGYVLTYEILSKEIRPDIAKIKDKLEVHDLRFKALDLIS